MKGVVAVILAAGKGDRIGGPKALLAWPSPSGGERPLAIAHAEERIAAESERAVIVTRKQMLPTLLRYVRPGVDLLASDAADDLGPAGSLAFAVPRLGGVEKVVVTPVDAVPARAATVAQLLARLDASPDVLAVRPTHNSRGGHPVVLRAEALSRYAEASPPPLRDHLKSLGPRCVDEPVDDAAVLTDLDRPADVVRILRAMPRFLS